MNIFDTKIETKFAVFQKQKNDKWIICGRYGDPSKYYYKSQKAAEEWLLKIRSGKGKKTLNSYYCDYAEYGIFKLTWMEVL